MLIIERLTEDDATALLDDLIALLRDAVDGGAAVGFLPPLTVRAARAYWVEVIEAVENGGRVLLAATLDGQLVGTVQLDLPTRPNARQRAEVQKLLVHTAARGQGIARRLMDEVEAVAQQERRTTLVLDTRQGDVGEQVYAKIGYTRAGEIPQFAQSADGTLHTTVLFYKLLG